MVASAYVLRQLNRPREAGLNIDSALQIMLETKDYPAGKITLSDEIEAVLRGWADHLADTGEAQRAAAIYQELLDKVMESHPDPKRDLRDASGLSRIYGALADLHRRNGRADQAQSLAAQRVEIWQEWNRKLPQNAFIRKQLEAAMPR